MRVILVIVFSFLSIGAFAQKKAKVSSRDTLRDVYKGVLPCADCSGIETELTLVHERYDGMGLYILKESYIGKDSFVTKGTWSHHRGMHGNKNATVVELYNDMPDSDSRYFQQLKNGDLKMLDRELKDIESQWNYVLKKTGSDVISNGRK